MKRGCRRHDDRRLDRRPQKPPRRKARIGNRSNAARRVRPDARRNKTSASEIGLDPITQSLPEEQFLEADLSVQSADRHCRRRASCSSVLPLSQRLNVDRARES